jgi:hypothetical protein
VTQRHRLLTAFGAVVLQKTVAQRAEFFVEKAQVPDGSTVGFFSDERPVP